VDLAFPATLDAGRGQAADNLDGTCSNLSCHGGQTTPEWWTGTIAVDVQCRSCHEAGTGEDNGYFSGRHTLHVSRRGYDCTVCHSTARLADVHFAGLDTPGREGVAPTTIGGADTRVTSYNPATRSCSTQGCHGSERW
jgi:predicted CxxxxCH...CXXCH cytochrome family protein